MSVLVDMIRDADPAARHRPWPRIPVDADAWRSITAELAQGGAALLGLWGERAQVHMAAIDAATDAIAVVSLECPDGCFPSVGLAHPPALRLERAIRDLFGLEPADGPDRRPWLDHGCWGIRHPLGPDAPLPAEGEPYVFLPSEGESLHQIAVGPVHAGIIEPGHFRFTVNGEAVVRLEERLGYAHKGVERLMEGAALEHAAKLAGRISGDSTVAYGLAFARAAETALAVEPPPRAVWLRGLMAELERLANHLGDIGAVCNDAAFALMPAHCGVLREYVLRAAESCFGHRLMMDRIVPGGVAADLDTGGVACLHALLDTLKHRFPPLVRLYDETASLQDRTVGTGILRPELARQYGCGGFVGRASGRGFDARKSPGYAPYDRLDFSVPVLHQGDVNARIWVRIREIEQSVGLIGQIIDRLPAGPIRAAFAPEGREPSEGAALVEGFRGDVLAWVRIAKDGRVARCHLRDPSWFQWPVLEAAIDGNIVADFPLCNKSFNCSYSGHDL